MPVAKPGTALSIPLQPNSLGADVMVSLSSSLAAASRDLVSAVRAAVAFPLLSFWVASIWHDPCLRQQLFAVAWRLVIGAGLIAEWLAIRAVAAPAPGSAARPSRTAGTSETGAAWPRASPGAGSKSAPAIAVRSDMSLSLVAMPLL